MADYRGVVKIRHGVLETADAGKCSWQLVMYFYSENRPEAADDFDMVR